MWLITEVGTKEVRLGLDWIKVHRVWTLDCLRREMFIIAVRYLHLLT